MSINGICISTKHEKELTHVTNLIRKLSPETEIYNFTEVLDDISILGNCDFIFPIGGDGTVAWIVRKFYRTFGAENLSKLKPIVPVIRPKSVGYLKQIDYAEDKFIEGFQQLLDGDYYVLDRTVLNTEIHGLEYVGVNEIYVHTAPNLGIFEVYLSANGKFHKITRTMADGLLVTTSIGSTGWALSFDGQISFSEDSLGLVFVGGIHTSANFQIPRKRLKISLELKNSPIAKTSVEAYRNARKRQDLTPDDNPEKTLQLVFGSRVIIDGKIISFDTQEIEISADLSIPFAILTRETFMDKARRLTEPQDVK